MRAISIRVFVEVILMLFMGRVEMTCFLNTRDTWCITERLDILSMQLFIFTINACNKLLGSFTLLFVMVKDGTAVICTHIISLPVQCRGVVNAKEVIEQLIIVHFSRIVREMKYLRMTSVTVFDLCIGNGLCIFSAHKPNRVG